MLYKIYVSCATDSTYLKTIAVMIYSLMRHTSNPIELYVMNSECDIKVLNNLKKLFPNLELIFLEINKLKFKKFKKSNRINEITYYRLLLCDLLPPFISKIIYLDGDLILRKDILNLWEINLHNKIIGAIPDIGPYTRYVSSSKALTLYKKLKIPEYSMYFNAGVLLIDVELWKAKKIKEKIESYLLKNRDYQDGLNAILWNNWYRIDYSWNAISDIFDNPDFCLKELGENKYQKVISDPYIVHFTLSIKPFLKECRHIYRQEYQECMDNVIKIIDDFAE